MICPNRFLERQQVFIDCLRLLTNHELGNELRIVSELEVPGGSVDYCLASVRDGKAKDFVGIEIQTLDTTGTVWPERQRFLRPFVRVSSKDTNSTKPFGMNWKMTAKTVLMQLHHKAGTFEHLGKRLVVVLQDGLLADMRQKFTFGHIAGARDGDTVHFHSYRLARQASGYRIEFADRVTTDSAGIAKCLGLQAESKVELEAMFEAINLRLSESQLLTLSSGTSPSS
jgi:hypothetical protein